MARHMTGMRVLVTGGAGFIGSELVHQLCQAGATVVVADSLVNGKREHLAGLPGDRCRLAEVDVRDPEPMARLLRQTDLVYHLACLGVRHSIHSPLENHEVNATATLRLLGLARAAGVRRFVHVSSSEVYGTAVRVPMTEDHPTAPLTVYGASKLAGERYAAAYFHTYGLPTVVVRPFNAYGPRSHHEGDCGEVIPKFLLRALAGKPLVVFGDGRQTRDFTYVSDTAAGILAAGLTEAAVGRTINLGTSTEVSVTELTRMVAQVVGADRVGVVYHPDRPGDVKRLYADASLAYKLLGFAPTVTLHAGLSKLRDWYATQPPAADLLRDERERNWEVSEATLSEVQS